MIKKVLFGLVVMQAVLLNAQTAISGYISAADTETLQEIKLSQIAIEEMGNATETKLIASTTIDQNGFFEFKKQLLSDKNTIYKIHIMRFEKVLKDTLRVEKLFILSNKDSIHFKKSKEPFANYDNSNVADKEWLKLRNFEDRLKPFKTQKEDSLSAAYIGNLKTYTKDSLEILMVKLIGIKQLDNKELLEKDIVKNSEYYVALLNEFKESDIERSEYLFLENKLAFLTVEKMESKYASSVVVNIILGLVIASLVFLLFRLMLRKNTPIVVDLSKQEKNIQGLILEGKSNKEIANALFISLSTVKTHITNIYNKLQVSSRQELMRKTQNS